MKVTVKDLVKSSTVLAGRLGLGREITSPQIMTPDLVARVFGRDASSGIMHISPTQAAYLCSRPRDERLRLVRDVVKQKPACIMVTGGAICRELIDRAESVKIPVIKSSNVQGLRRILTEKLLPRVSIHGVLVQILGLGALIIGESAVGKSEAALDLVLRGHKLVADDMVVLAKTDGVISGRAEDIGRDLLQIRGLGIINIRAIYGETATIDSCAVGLVVELEEWRKGHQYSLVGLRERRYRLLGINLPYLKLPVKPGRNMATLIEVAVRNQLLKNRGVFTARELNRKLRLRLSE
jgi:HPr kinase/phosphorylase